MLSWVESLIQPRLFVCVILIVQYTVLCLSAGALQRMTDFVFKNKKGKLWWLTAGLTVTNNPNFIIEIELII